MAHVHAHGPGGSVPTRRLGVVLGITAVYALAELAGGWLSNSLALLADAGHMATDVAALGLALLATWSARRPPDPARTYGYQRAEILAALGNGVLLVVIAVAILHEAWERWARPPQVAFGLMAGIAAGGLLVNLVGAGLLHRHQHGLNMRAAYLHVLGDLLGSVATLVAAAAIGLAGWRWADPAASVLIGGIIVLGAVRLVLDSVDVLMESTPRHLDAQRVAEGLAAMEGVQGVHDLHLWSVAGSRPLLTAHLVLDHSRRPGDVLREATALLRQRYAIEHVTLQIEPSDFAIEIEGLTVRRGE